VSPGGPREAVGPPGHQQEEDGVKQIRRRWNMWRFRRWEKRLIERGYLRGDDRFDVS
jgi:hypothetical protein